MIKVSEIQGKYGDYLIDEDKLKEILINPKPKTVWDLKDGDTYYLLCSDGTICNYVWNSEEVADIESRSNGFCFLTYEEAEFERERKKVESELLRYGGTRDMMSLSLGDKNIRKYFITYNHETDSSSLCVDCFWTVNHQGIIYFKSEKAIQNAINKIGEDRIKKYLFYVKD